DLLAAAKEPLSWEVRQAAVAALGTVAWDEKAGPPFLVLKGLFAALGDNAIQVRMAAIQSMTMLGQPKEDSVLLAEANQLDLVAKKDGEPSIRIWAQVALMNLTGNVAKERLNPICDLTGDKESAVRVEAVRAIGTIGKDAKSAVPILISALGDPEPTVVATAAWALGRMESGGMAAVPALQKISTDPKATDSLKKVAQDAVDSIMGKKKDKK
ncbi:MAG: HEAT repeat domain-containing protein, partial [Gemmataceae bacterium]|nr:HEAT repeat domain-containing protein [Gemmataceae bacterium]